MSFECHVTVPKPKSTVAMDHLASYHRWKTSFIIGDPLLGNAGYYYFTTHHADYKAIFAKMEELSALLDALGVKVLRKKIEDIVYDTKTQLLNGNYDARLNASQLIAETKSEHGCDGKCQQCAGA